jgi:hypothetical protein
VNVSEPPAHLCPGTGNLSAKEDEGLSLGTLGGWGGAGDREPSFPVVAVRLPAPAHDLRVLYTVPWAVMVQTAPVQSMGPCTEKCVEWKQVHIHSA